MILWFEGACFFYKQKITCYLSPLKYNFSDNFLWEKLACTWVFYLWEVHEFEEILCQTLSWEVHEFFFLIMASILFVGYKSCIYLSNSKDAWRAGSKHDNLRKKENLRFNI